MSTLAIIIACGKEEEIVSGTEVAFLSMGSRPVLAHSLKTFHESAVVDEIIVVVSKERVEGSLQVIKRFGFTKVRGVVIGGVNRLSSLRTVFSKISKPASIIILHEASRPFVSDNVIVETVKAAKRYGSSIAAHKLPDAVKVAIKGLKSSKTLERNSAWAAQTPQVFKNEVLKKILDLKNKNIKLIDDESEWVKSPAEVHLIESGCGNLKIRSAEDLTIATAMFNARLNR